VSGLSVAIITKNEERDLPVALASVGFADEIVVVDSGSSDRTLEIAAEAGAKIVRYPWQGYAAQKNLAIDHCTQEWVLSLDADECLSAELAEDVARVVSGETQGFDYYSVPRLSLFVDRWMRHSGWYPDRQLRLFRRGRGHFADRKVHEAIVPDGPVGRLAGDLLHYSFRSVSDYVDRMNRYSSLGAQMLRESGRAGSSGRMALGWVLVRKFLEVYVLKRGFLDGTHGFVVSCLAAYTVFLRTAKLWRPED